MGGEKQSLLIRDWQPIQPPYSETDSLGILMSCALYAFVNVELTHTHALQTQWHCTNARTHRGTCSSGPAQWSHGHKAQHNERSVAHSSVKWSSSSGQMFVSFAFSGRWPLNVGRLPFAVISLSFKIQNQIWNLVSFDFCFFSQLIRFAFSPFSESLLCSDGYMNFLMVVLQQLCLSSLNLTLIGYRAFLLIGFLENKIGS